jgi:hypothetical protein
LISVTGCSTYHIAPRTVLQLAAVPKRQLPLVSLAARRDSDGKPVYLRNDLVRLDEHPTLDGYRAHVTRPNEFAIAAIPVGVASVVLLGLGSYGVHHLAPQLQEIKGERCEKDSFGLCSIGKGIGEGVITTALSFSGVAVAAGILSGMMTIALSARASTGAEVRRGPSSLRLGELPSETPKRPRPDERDDLDVSRGSSKESRPRL